MIGRRFVDRSRVPHVVSKAIVTTMQPGSVIVDISIDQRHFRLASGGISALREDNGFGKGVNTYRGYLTLPASS